MILNLLFFIESIIWSNPDPTNWWDGKGYCDISARIKDAFALGVPGAAIGICRFLADATNPDPTQKDLIHSRTRRNMIDLFFGIILPFVLIAIKAVVEISRYWVFGITGCTGTIDFSWVAFFFYPLWCPLLCLIAAGYACIPSRKLC